MRAYILVDLGFGDAGKGLLTDFLTRKLNAALVVRYNGGAQAGHNVVTADGRHHTFSQFGAGSFNPRARTFLSRHMVIHPSALLVEGDVLASKGVPNPFARLAISAQALVITPFHQALNRIRELVRGANRHGSCGVGVGEAVEDAFAHPHAHLRAGDLTNPNLLREKAAEIRRRTWEQATALLKNQPLNAALLREYAVFEHEAILEQWLTTMERFRHLNLVVEDARLADWLAETENVIFEGAQGVLLDAEAGFHPYTTWSRCTTHNAESLLREFAPAAQVIRLGILRAYAVRHGPGPLPTETEVLTPLIREHNQANEWQGRVRYGWFDAMLGRYALAVNGGVDALALTHMDILPRLPAWTYCAEYADFPRFPLPPPASLDERAAFTQRLFDIRPCLQTCPPREATVLATIQTLLQRPVGLISRGPRAEEVAICLCGGFPTDGVGNLGRR